MKMCKAILMVLSAFLASASAHGVLYVQVLHNGDMHSRFNETEVDPFLWKCTSGSEKCVGGFSRVKRAADQFRKEAAEKQLPTLFLNVGDTFQGTPYYMMEKWRVVAPLVDALGFHATCLGNHEFDHGIDNLVQFLNHLQTPLTVCNLDLESEPRLKDVKNLKSSVILAVGDTRIGVTSYLTPRTVGSSKTENLEMFDEISSLRKEARRLIDEEGIKIIIALGHSGFDRDREIAKEVEEISMIIGGDSHTLLYTPMEAAPSIEVPKQVYPFFVTQKSGKKVPIIHAFAFTKYLGRVFVSFDKETGEVIKAEGNPVLLDSSFEKDVDVQRLVDSWTTSVDERLASRLGYVKVPLNRSVPVETPFNIETTAGNFIADALQNYSIRLALESNAPTWTRAPIAFYNRGGIMNNLIPVDAQGATTLADVHSMVQFQNPLFEIELKGSTIWKVMEIAADMDFHRLGILDFAGLRVVYDLEEGVQNPTGGRLSSIQVLCKACPIPRYEEIDLQKTYSVITIEGLLIGKGVFAVLKNEWINPVKLDKTDTDAVAEYFQKLHYVYAKIDGRISFRCRRKGFVGTLADHCEDAWNWAKPHSVLKS